MTPIPMRPAIPVSVQSKKATTTVSSGPIHSEFKPKFKYSKRLTSFDSKFTTLPGVVSPRAVCVKRNDCFCTRKKKSSLMH